MEAYLQEYSLRNGHSAVKTTQLKRLFLTFDCDGRLFQDVSISNKRIVYTLNLENDDLFWFQENYLKMSE